MLALIGTILAASLLGSLHCAGMCGAFVAFAVGGREAGSAKGQGPGRVALQMAYHGGRLVTYVALGTLAGAVGSMVNLGGSLVGVQRVAAVLAGAMMVGFGVVTLLRVAGVKVHVAKSPVALQKLVMAGHRASMAMAPVQRAAVIGLLTTLLPCGWLWAFVITAAGTGSAAWGAAAMAAFWIGTLPVLVGLGVGIQHVGPRIAARLPAVTALVIVGVGVYTICTRITMPMARAGTMQVKDASELKAGVGKIDHATLPCCAGKAPMGNTTTTQAVPAERKEGEHDGAK